MKNSKHLSLNLKDVGHGFLMAFLGAALAGIYTSLKAGALPTPIEMKTQALIGLGAGISYLIKKILSNSDNEFFTKEQKTPLN